MTQAMSDDELVDPDAVIRMPLPIGATGADALKQVWAMLLQVYPDIHLRVEDLIAEDDKVGRTTVTATHQGEFMGVAATGKPVTYNEIFIFRFAAGPSRAAATPAPSVPPRPWPSLTPRSRIAEETAAAHRFRDRHAYR
jgi:hypothetical protein